MLLLLQGPRLPQGLLVMAHEESQNKEIDVRGKTNPKTLGASSTRAPGKISDRPMTWTSE